MKISRRLFHISRISALLLGLGLSLTASDANAQTVAANNTALSAVSTVGTSAVVRLGFATEGDSDSLIFFASASPCSLNSGAGDGGSQVPSSNGDCWLAHFLSSGIDVKDWGLTNDPVKFYVNSSTGSDTSNYCVLAALPCKTYLHAYQMAVKFDLQQANGEIHLAAGSYQGFAMSGVLRGNSGGASSGQYLFTIGAGSGSTTITDSTSAAYVMDVSNGMTAIFNDLTIAVPANEVGIFVQNPGSYVYVPGGSDLVFNGASATSSVAMYTEGPSGLEFGTTSAVTLTGSFSYILDAVEESRISIDPGTASTFTCSGLTLGISFAYVQTAEMDLQGIAFSGCSSDARPYYIMGNGFINNPSNVTLPFTGVGILQTGGRYNVSDVPCIGGSAGCAIATAPTGAGTGATFAVAGQAGIHSGTVLMTAGTGASSTGLLYLQFASVINTDSVTTGACVAGLSREQGAGIGWQTTGTATINYQTAGWNQPEVLGITWSNGGSALISGDVYAVAWHCDNP